MDNSSDKKVIEVLNKDFFPLFKVVFEENYRFRDVDSDYLLNDTPDELLRRSNSATLYIKERVDLEWAIMYTGLSFDMVAASLEIKEIKELYSYWKSVYVENPPVMFIYQNQVFKKPYVMMEQLCVSGSPIESEKYYTTEDSVKVDFFKAYVKPVGKDTALIFAEQVYYNGELLFSNDELKFMKVPTYSVSSIVDFLKGKLPIGTRYESDWESGTL